MKADECDFRDLILWMSIVLGIWCTLYSQQLDKVSHYKLMPFILYNVIFLQDI